MATARCNYAAAVWGGRVYVFGGEADGAEIRSVERYDVPRTRCADAAWVSFSYGVRAIVRA